LYYIFLCNLTSYSKNTPTIGLQHTMKWHLRTPIWNMIEIKIVSSLLYFIQNKLLHVGREYWALQFYRKLNRNCNGRQFSSCQCIIRHGLPEGCYQPQESTTMTLTLFFQVIIGMPLSYFSLCISYFNDMSLCSS
jgi:hypothetical protein